jgi:membrane glycosyltransferase
MAKRQSKFLSVLTAPSTGTLARSLISATATISVIGVFALLRVTFRSTPEDMIQRCLVCLFPGAFMWISAYDLLAIALYRLGIDKSSRELVIRPGEDNPNATPFTTTQKLQFVHPLLIGFALFFIAVVMLTDPQPGSRQTPAEISFPVVSQLTN